MKFTLPLSPDYCAHWNLWDGVREIYQNALDAGDADMKYNAATERLDISSAGCLTPETLVLGTSSKRNDKSKRGKFGEGYKLALLVLTRLEHRVVIHSGAEIWIAKLEHDEHFGATVLNVYTCAAKPIEGVHFYIDNVDTEAEDLIRSNVRSNPNEDETILDDAGQAGRIYVGGLYVSTAKGFKCGYSFRPRTITLDRDRGMIDGFDLAYQTSQLWSLCYGPRVSELLEAEAPDVEYVESHVHSGSSFASAHYGYYVSRHGSAVPVSNQAEIQRASAAGVKWVLVPEKVKSLLHLVTSWFIPDNKSLLDQLKEFREQFKYHLPRDGQRRLDDIIQGME